jgi:hypothetical protein
MRFKIFHREETLELSDVIPVLEHLGLRVVSEHPYRIITATQQIIWLHDFQLSYNQPTAIDVHVGHGFPASTLPGETATSWRPPPMHPEVDMPAPVKLLQPRVLPILPGREEAAAGDDLSWFDRAEEEPSDERGRRKGRD